MAWTARPLNALAESGRGAKIHNPLLEMQNDQ